MLWVGVISNIYFLCQVDMKTWQVFGQKVNEVGQVATPECGTEIKAEEVAEKSLFWSSL